MFLSNVAKPQFYFFNSEPPKFDVSFSKHSIESYTQNSFFNVLKIANRGSRTEDFTLNFTVPDGWKVLGDEKQQLTLHPQDSIFIPVRVSVGTKVRGDIGYSVIASLTDSKGNTIKNEYCFIKIPRVSEVKISIPVSTNYFDTKTGYAEFSLAIQNKGNREELVNVVFEPELGLGIGFNLLTNYSEDLLIPPYKDTSFTYSVKLKDTKIEGKESYKLNIKASTISNKLDQTIWFRLLNSELQNYIPPKDKLLTLDLTAQGLLSESRKPQYVAQINGNLLLNNKKEIYYSYRNYSSYRLDELYKTNHMYLGGYFDKFQVEFGDSYRSQESSLSGRGIFLGFKNKLFQGNFIYNKETSSEKTKNIGLLLTYKHKGANNRFGLGLINNRDDIKNINSYIGTIETNFRLNKVHSFNILAALNSIERDLDGKNKQIEYGWEFNYFSKLPKLTTNIRTKFGSLNYYGKYKGRFISNASSNYYFNTKHKLSLFVSNNEFNTPEIVNNITYYINTNTNTDIKLDHSINITDKALFYYGPGIEIHNKSFDNSNITYKDFFTTNAYKIQTGARFKGDNFLSYLSPKLVIGKVYVAKFPKIFGDDYYYKRLDRNFTYYYVNVSYNAQKWGLVSSYESGPRNIFAQYNYFYISRTSRVLRVNPFVNTFIYKRIINLDLNVAYNNDMILKSSFINISAQLLWYLPKDWTARLYTFYSIHNRADRNGVNEKFQNLYLEAGIKRELNLPHPRVQYHNIKMIFFKDLNGNFVQDPNEPGIKNVLMTLNRDQLGTTDRIPGDFNSIDLISDYLGQINIEDIPNGNYKIIYNPIGKEAGTFSKALEEIDLKLDENKVLYIPFVEKNKVFGRVILNRSRLSGLGKQDISNIRITATDSKGRTYPTLTDISGQFTIYAPITDNYVVTINNIFYENFDLRQNNYKVQFNGYKQFEVNFVFDEKIRRINFSPSSQDAQLASVLQVRRTNLRGIIKDAGSLNPIRARVSLINTKTNTVLSSIYSSSQSGEYSLTFMADDNYLLEVYLDGYWYHSENLNLNQVTTFLNITKDILLKPIAIGSKIELNIKFQINKTDLTAEAVAELQRLLRLLKDNENIKIEIQGHSDDLEALNNPAISEERAKRVASYLIENGFSNLQIRGFGNTSPISPNDTEENRALNRRIEVEVISK